jgi:hypothetical protein
MARDLLYKLNFRSPTLTPKYTGQLVHPISYLSAHSYCLRISTDFNRLIPTFHPPTFICPERRIGGDEKKYKKSFPFIPLWPIYSPAKAQPSQD